MLFASFLYLLPQTVLLPITNFFRIIKNKNFELITLTPEKILTLLALPNIIFFILVYITSNKTFPHWIMPGWLSYFTNYCKNFSNSNSRIKNNYLFNFYYTYLVFIGSNHFPFTNRNTNPLSKKSAKLG